MRVLKIKSKLSEIYLNKIIFNSFLWRGIHRLQFQIAVCRYSMYTFTRKYIYAQKQAFRGLLKNQKNNPWKITLYEFSYVFFDLSFRLSTCLGTFLELYHKFCLDFGIVLKTHMKSCMTEPDFLEKFCLPKKFEKWTRNGPKTRCI